MTVDSIKNVAVIGAGTMGQGIAQLCAMAGYRVMLYDIQAELTKTALGAIRKRLDAAVGKSKITALQKDETLARISAVGDFRQLQVDLVIEAVIERLEVKQKIFQEVEKWNGKDCLLTSNTSSISITQIATAIKHPGRFAGLHFFNPAPAMKLVEIIKGTSTDEGTIALLKEFTQTISKSAVLATDSPGFIVNRVARHYYTEALKVLEERTATIDAIDGLLKATGFKMGPFELMDLIGVDVNYAVTVSLYEAFHHEPKFRPSRIQRQMVEAGYLGQKAGKGFYEYAVHAKK